MIFYLPLQTEVVFRRYPWMNFVLIGCCIFSYVVLNLLQLGLPVFGEMILDGWSITGLVGHVFLHADFWHLFGNMIFLWVFGNALNERMGQGNYLLFFFCAGVISAAVHNVFDGSYAVGASGAVNGVVGAYLILYPTNRISCFWIFLFRGGVVQVAGYWLIGLWVLQDVWGALAGRGEIAYWAHLGGFLFGVGAGSYLLKKGLVKLSSYDNPDLLTILNLHQPIPESEPVDIGLPGEMAFDCPECGKPQRVHESRFGSRITCWSCRTPLQLEEDPSL